MGASPPSPPRPMFAGDGRRGQCLPDALDGMARSYWQAPQNRKMVVSIVAAAWRRLRLGGRGESRMTPRLLSDASPQAWLLQYSPRRRDALEGVEEMMAPTTMTAAFIGARGWPAAAAVLPPAEYSDLRNLQPV